MKTFDSVVATLSSFENPFLVAKSCQLVIVPAICLPYAVPKDADIWHIVFLLYKILRARSHIVNLFLMLTFVVVKY